MHQWEVDLERSRDVEREKAKKELTLRDYFAAQALAGILANNTPHYAVSNARMAYEHADEMLKARGGG